MLMEKIRNAGKKHRGVMIAVVACLCLAMVIGFATWGAISNPGAGDIDSQIAYYEQYLDQLLANEEKDNTTVGQIAGVYEILASLYYQNGETEKYTESYNNANNNYITYYEYLVDEQRNSEGDNKALLASYLEKLSSYYANAGDTEKSESAKTEALGYYKEVYTEYVDKAKADVEENSGDPVYLRTVAYYLTVLGSVYEEQANEEEATETYNEAVSYYSQAIDLLKAQEAEKADDTEYLRSVAEYYVSQAGVYELLADEDNKKQAYQNAGEYYNKIVTALGENAAADDKAEAITAYAECLNMAEDTENAKIQYEQAITLAPKNIDVVVSYIGFVLQTQGVVAAYELLPEYENNFSGDDKDEFDNLAAYITLYYQILNSQNTSTTDEETTSSVEENTSTTEETSITEENNAE